MYHVKTFLTWISFCLERPFDILPCRYDSQETEGSTSNVISGSLLIDM